MFSGSKSEKQSTYTSQPLKDYGVPLGSKVCIFSGTKNNLSATKNNISGLKNNFSSTKIILVRLKIQTFEPNGTP